MFRSYFNRETSVATKTPFEQTEEFIAINKSITSIKKKRDELEPAAKTNGVSSLEYLKWYALDVLVKSFDAKIAVYNAHPAYANLQVKLEMANALLKSVNTIWDYAKSVLKRHRNNYQAARNALMAVGVLSASVVAAVNVPLTFFGSGLITYFLAKETGFATASSLGLYDNEPETVKLIKTFKTELESLINNLVIMQGIDQDIQTENDHVTDVHANSPVIISMIEEEPPQLRIKQC
jgi:hypothetical protein